MRPAPARPFRIIGGHNSGFDCKYFDTKEARDAAAFDMANKFEEQVITELWSREHDQGQLNQGWACDGAVKPSEVVKAAKVKAETELEKQRDLTVSDYESR